MAGTNLSTAAVAVCAAVGGAALALVAAHFTAPEPVLEDATARDAAAVLEQRLGRVESALARTDDRMSGMRRDLGTLSRAIGDLGEGVSGLSRRVEELAKRAALPRTVAVPAPGTGAHSAEARDPLTTAPAQKESGASSIEPNVSTLIRNLLESKEDAVRFPAATELGRLGAEDGIPALARALRDDRHFLVRRAAARSLGRIKAWNAVPTLIDALEDKEGYVAQQANFALRAITGTDFGVKQDMRPSERRRKAGEARRWWAVNGNSPPAGVSLRAAE